MGMGMGKQTASTSTLFLSIAASTCPPDFSSLTSPSGLAALSVNLQVDVTSLVIGAVTCLECSQVPDVTDQCPATRDLDFCGDLSNAITCATLGCAITPDGPLDTDPTCVFDLGTTSGIANYFTTVCSPAL
jgi:hypothetical protein